MSIVNIERIRRPRRRNRNPNEDMLINILSFIKYNETDAIINLIQNRHIMINTVFTNGFSLLHMAVREKKYNIVELLLNLGIDRTILSTLHRQTAMHIACMNGFISIIRLMISKGREDLEIFDRYRKTPLNYAIDYGNNPIVRFLIENGVDCSYLPLSIINELNESRERRLQRDREIREYEETLLIQEHHRSRRIRILRRPEIVEEIKTEVVRPSKDIIDLIVNNEIAKGAICPISMEEIEKETAVVTNCFHVFSRDNIEYWLQSKNFCPVCKTKCFVL